MNAALTRQCLGHDKLTNLKGIPAMDMPVFRNTIAVSKAYNPGGAKKANAQDDNCDGAWFKRFDFSLPGVTKETVHQRHVATIDHETGKEKRVPSSVCDEKTSRMLYALLNADGQIKSYDIRLVRHLANKALPDIVELTNEVIKSSLPTVIGMNTHTHGAN